MEGTLLNSIPVLNLSLGKKQAVCLSSREQNYIRSKTNKYTGKAIPTV
jgi:hypothetical protein